MHQSASSPARRRLQRWGAAVVGTLTVLLLAAAATLFLQGGRWFVVRTPSMGEAAPVGTLVITERTAFDRLKVGDVVSFAPPNRPGTVFTHRVVALGPAAGTTRGDINGSPDPWPLTAGTLVGRVAATLPGAGWLVRAFPPLLGGVLVSWLLTGRVSSPTWRRSLRNLGVCITASYVISTERPLAGAEVITSRQGPEGLIAEVVSTGLLPIRFGGDPDAPGLSSGEVGRLVLQAVGTPPHYGLDLHLDPSPVQWGLLIALCLAPAVAGACIGTRAPAPEPAR